MSSSWCFWCDVSDIQWKANVSGLRCSIQRIKDMCFRQDLQKANRLGIVHETIFDFVEIKNFIVPPLHLGLGLGNNILDI